MRMPKLTEFCAVMAVLLFMNQCSMYYHESELPEEDYSWEAETSGAWAQEGSNWDYADDAEYQKPCECGCVPTIHTPTTAPLTM